MSQKPDHHVFSCAQKNNQKFGQSQKTSAFS